MLRARHLCVCQEKFVYYVSHITVQNIYFRINNKPHGQGRVVWSNGATYTGQFAEGKYHGLGVYVWPSGKKFVGRWVRGVKEGHGLYSWPNGKKYDGEYKDGLKDGYGRMTWPDGSSYCGGFKRNKRCGRGVQTASDGTMVHCGQWKNDLPVLEVDGDGSATAPTKRSSIQSPSIILIEYPSLGNVVRYQHLMDTYNHTFLAIRVLDERPRINLNIKYIEFFDGQKDWNLTGPALEAEYFDLDLDPFEMTNRIHKIPYGFRRRLHEIMMDLYHCKGESCRRAAGSEVLDDIHAYQKDRFTVQ